MQISFRQATQADIDLLIEFMRQFYEIDLYPFDYQIARAAMEKIVSDPALGRVWVILEGEAPVGYIVLTLGYSLEYHGRDAFIDEVYIQASHRGKGIGSKSIKFIEEQSKRLGVNALHLEVERGNQAGQLLYSKSGFKSHDRHLMTKWIKK